ncbi:aminotransferase class IV [Micromonospora sp. LAH09]|uniref:aminotransferase class IV n=1 Tax=Micromonospora cabrerizensis TaxID=2911213 RepID=UPI001EE82289|nr:aminotransferase class IV [Micromonospora cabrerizensis]MCG5468903.1 aminotransferase class IV [Micromonospora cabrerizensis]
MTHVELNGGPADVDAMHRAATWNYGHFTSMQVRNRAVIGLGLHLCRLREGSAALFPDATSPSDDEIRAFIGHALRDEQDASVRVTVLPSLTNGASTDVMVSVSEPTLETPRPPLRVRTVRYERELPHLKHMATLGLTYHYLQARRAGFDDVLFAGQDGFLREGSVWNIAFWDGDRVIWPEAPMLTGITMQVLRLGMRKLGIPDETRRLTRESLNGIRAAATTNSHCPAQPVAAVDETAFPGDDTFTSLLHRAWQEAPWEPVRIESRTPLAAVGLPTPTPSSTARTSVG